MGLYIILFKLLGNCRLFFIIVALLCIFIIVEEVLFLVFFTVDVERMNGWGTKGLNSLVSFRFIRKGFLKRRIRIWESRGVGKGFGMRLIRFLGVCFIDLLV